MQQYIQTIKNKATTKNRKIRKKFFCKRPLVKQKHTATFVLALEPLGGINISLLNRQ